ncbi:hypothetical protein CLCR_01768 [Cladophialophora carrionii]|uniref:Uncharacterized protein n=1 Tax=Cladophialophora carrionii TaxID=86049 RepID=A0A1C1CAV6_9EURO|nr:hypothetical protein CLCR_01768 [Cladophialophora carrionii]
MDIAPGWTLHLDEIAKGTFDAFERRVLNRKYPRVPDARKVTGSRFWQVDENGHHEIYCHLQDETGETGVGATSVDILTGRPSTQSSRVELG